MTELTWTTVEKTDWGDGPWQTEPDKIQWVDEASGLDCLIHRGPMGALCGYVGVPPEHPWHGHHYDDIDVDVSVHGGLTYADRCDPDATEEHGICHVPAPGRPHDIWWLGFDCGHLMDRIPGLEALERTHGFPAIPFELAKTYKPVAYVREEVTSLAQQIAAA